MRDGPGHERRAVARLPCWVSLDDSEILAFARKVSGTSLTLTLAEARASTLRERGEAALRLSLPDGKEDLRLSAEVVAVDRGEITLRVRDAEASRRLAMYAESFRPTVMVADADREYLEVYRTLTAQYHVVHVDTGEQLLRELSAHAPRALLLSEQLPDMHSLELLQKLSEREPAGSSACRIVVSDHTVAGQVRTLVNDGRIFAYLRKPFDAPHLAQTTQRALEAFELGRENDLLAAELSRANDRLKRENAYLRRRLVGVAGFEELIGTSAQLRGVLEDVAKVSRSDITVHISGETGTGKELVARALHLGSSRSSHPFVAQSFAGLSDGMLQSSLFGHKKGAFTGAENDHAGVFQRAHHGTLFLDEVTDLSPSAQASLLRVLQEGELTPIGGHSPLSVDLRVISGSQKDLRREIAEGRFREDLFFRLAVVVLALPPLRERKGDIPLLAMHFLDLHCEEKRKDIRGFSYEAMAALERYLWPGNVRELENEIERLVILAGGRGRIVLEMLSPRIRDAGPPQSLAPPPPPSDRLHISLGQSLDDATAQLERALLERALNQAQGNVTLAAKALGIERSRASKLRDRLGLGPV